MYVCICNAITDTEIQEAINQGACSMKCLRSELGVGSQCGKCETYATKMIAASTIAAPASFVPIPLNHKPSQS